MASGNGKRDSGFCLPFVFWDDVFDDRTVLGDLYLRVMQDLR
jgi:hypothetical protein